MTGSAGGRLAQGDASALAPFEGYVQMLKEFGLPLASAFNLRHEWWELLKLLWNDKQQASQAQQGTITVLSDGT